MSRLLLLSALLVLVLTVTVKTPPRWPFALVAAGALLGVWESYAGAYRLLTAPGMRRSAGEQIRLCAAWLSTTVTSLALLNMAACLAYPATFEWRGGGASLLDIAYMTMLTFASGGYGDVLPVTGLGKALVMLTSLAGHLYATMLCALIFQRLRED